MKHSLFLTLTLLTMSFNIFAHIENDSCAQEFVKEQENCTFNTAEQLEIKMLVTFSRIKNNHSKAYPELEKSQRKWLSYRSSYCNNALKNTRSNKSSVKILNCMNKLTKERIKTVSDDFN